MRKDIEFKAEDGTLLRGWHYLPDQRTGTHMKAVQIKSYGVAVERCGGLLRCGPLARGGIQIRVDRTG